MKRLLSGIALLVVMLLSAAGSAGAGVTYQFATTTPETVSVTYASATGFITSFVAFVPAGSNTCSITQTGVVGCGTVFFLPNDQVFDPHTGSWIYVDRLAVFYATGAPCNGCSYEFDFPVGTFGANGTYAEIHGYGQLTVSNSSCQVNPNDVKPMEGGPFSLDGNLTSMNAAFVPTDANGMPVGLNVKADACGFTGFDWVQIIDQWPGPSSLLAQSDPTLAPIIIPPASPIHDPPLGGYRSLVSQEPPYLGAYPFYYNPQSIPSACALKLSNGNCSIDIISNVGATLNFYDAPRNGCLPGGPLLALLVVCQGRSSGPGFMSFTTQLVGICNATPSVLCSGAGMPSTPLFQWTWNDNFNGNTGGGVFDVQTASLSLPDGSSGTGGVTITSLNGVTQTPPSVTCTAIPNTLWPPNGKLAEVILSGTITVGTQPIPAGGTIYVVTDEYGQFQPSGNIGLSDGGNYSLGVSLIAARNGNDLDGRTYTVRVIAADMIGNVGSCAAVVTVLHDQRQ